MPELLVANAAEQETPQVKFQKKALESSTVGLGDYVEGIEALLLGLSTVEILHWLQRARAISWNVREEEDWLQ